MTRTPRPAIAALGLVFALGACAAHEQSITVLTYNIHHGEGTDGTFDLPRIARVIRGAGADLVALQEVDVGTERAGGVDQAAELARLTGMHVVFGEAIPYRGGSYGDAVLSRFPVRQEIRWKLPAEPDHEERVAVGALVELPNGTVIRFLGTHLDHTRDPADRILQTRTLLDRAFPPQARRPPRPTLLLGDLNAEPDSEPLRLLSARFESAAPGGLPSYPSALPLRAIDWILFTPTERWRVLEVEVLDEPFASDHAPVRAVLQCTFTNIRTVFDHVIDESGRV